MPGSPEFIHPPALQLAVVLPGSFRPHPPCSLLPQGLWDPVGAWARRVTCRVGTRQGQMASLRHPLGESRNFQTAWGRHQGPGSGDLMLLAGQHLTSQTFRVREGPRDSSWGALGLRTLSWL